MMQGMIQPKEIAMFGILADAIRIAARQHEPKQGWDAPGHWKAEDHRTSAERRRDAEQMRRMLRRTGIL